MRLRLSNIAGVYDFKDNNINYRMSPGNYRRRTGVQKRLGKPGGVRTGDRQVDARDIKINFNNVSETDTPYIQKLHDILKMFDISKEPFYLEDTENDRRARVELESLNDKPVAEGLEMRIGDNNIDLVMLDAHWEDLDATLETSGSQGLEDQESMIVNNDAQIDCYPIIYVSPLDDNSEFSLINTTTGEVMTLGTAGFVPGTQFIIDSTGEGTIFLNDGVSMVELSSALADGTGFLHLVPGPNIILYESAFGDVNVIVEFRRRYAF